MTEQMREAFEAWVATTNGNYDYFDCYAQGYQAALSAVPAQEPTEEDLKFSSRTTWTFKDWYEHVGAWKTERDTLEFGSTIAFGAMMQQFAACLKWRLVNRQEPSIAKCSAIQKLGARLVDLLDEDQFKECERLLLSIAQQPAQEPVINAEFECESNGIVGTTSATVKRIVYQDDGSITVVIDHWPFNQTMQQSVKQESWISVIDCELKNNDTIYAHRSSGEVIEAVYRFWKDHKNPHRIISSEFGHESINNYKNVMARKVIPLPPTPSNPYNKVDFQGKLYITGLQNQIETLRKQLETAVNRINDMLQDDDGQAHKEARKFIGSLSAQKGTEHGTS